MKLRQWRYKLFHISYLFSWLAVGLLVGVAIGRYVYFSNLALLIVFIFIAIVSLYSRRWYAVVLILIAGFSVGLMRGSEFNQEIARADAYIGSEIRLTGDISQDPTLKNGSDLWSVQLSNLEVDGSELSGEAYATVLSEPLLRRGDTLTIRADAREGFGSFRLVMYRAETLHVSRHDDMFLDTRDRFGESVKQVMTEPESSLGLGFLVGQKTALSPDLSEQLKIVGLTHIVVASGYNLTILVRFARRLLARRSRYLAFVGSVALVVAFVLVSGLSPSMNRAAAVTILSLLAWYFGRKFHPVQLILYVASASAFLYPSYLWTDLGWLLSFTAFTGVLVLAPVISQLIFKNKSDEQFALPRLVIETLSAEIMTLPIIVLAFGYLPTLALLANVLVAPVIPFAMLLVFAAGVVGLVAPWAWAVALPANIAIAYIVAVVEHLSGFAWARLSFGIEAFWLFIWYGSLTLFIGFLWYRRRIDLMKSSVVE